MQSYGKDEIKMTQRVIKDDRMQTHSATRDAASLFKIPQRQLVPVTKEIIVRPIAKDDETKHHSEFSCDESEWVKIGCLEACKISFILRDGSRLFSYSLICKDELGGIESYMLARDAVQEHAQYSVYISNNRPESRDVKIVWGSLCEHTS